MKKHRIVCVLILSVHSFLLAFQGISDGPTWDELGHFAAGLEHWRHGRFELYSVNPPLTRLVALLPIALLRPDLDPDLSAEERGPGLRPESAIGGELATKSAGNFFELLTTARWMCIPFSLLGAYVCYAWAKTLWGISSGILALLLWCVSPTVLAYGHLITPDLSAAAMVAAALFSFRWWLIRDAKPPILADTSIIAAAASSALFRWIVAGVALGLAELTKTTCLILIPLYPFLWFVYRLCNPAQDASHVEVTRPRRFHLSFRLRVSPTMSSKSWLREGLCVVGILVLAWWILGLGYGFEGMFTPLGQFHFISSTLGGPVEIDGPWHVGNQFMGTWMEHLPVPLPANYVIGIDFMKWEFDHKEWSYLFGQWKLGGWWYYYILGLLIKEPIGTWVLLIVAVGAFLFGHKVYRVRLHEEIWVLAPFLALFMLVSSQTGFNHHIRYILPAMPFLFIWISRIANGFSAASVWRTGICNMGTRCYVSIVAVLALLWSVGSVIYIFPHTMSYFNESVGGPRNGWKYLDDSNIDWGQDLHYVKTWYDQHPESRPFHLMYDVTIIDPNYAGIQSYPVPVDLRSQEGRLAKKFEIGPLPGWYCVSIKRIQTNRSSTFNYFQDFAPVDWVGYTMPVYNITLEAANRWRSEHGMAEIDDQ